jgi:hippurate hydrolase
LEKTGVPFASKVQMKNSAGVTVPVMHACGHDMHMSVFLATANALVKLKNKWNGTLVFIGQQAEEGSQGADAMISAGLFKRFPKPDYIMAYHVSSSLPSGTIGYCVGPTFASVTSVDITFKGVGGHGAYPEKTIDPIVMASRAVLDFQTIVSRELLPTDPAVVTVGSFHGGVQYNIIPDEVKLQLTIRTYKEEVRQHILEAIERICKYIALSARMPEDKLPEVKVLKDPTPAVVNNKELVGKAVESYKKILGDSQVTEVLPAMVAEDFARYGLTEEKIPIFLTWLGAVEPGKYAQSVKNKTELPPLHSPEFFPDTDRTMRTGATAMARAIIDLMTKK